MKPTLAIGADHAGFEYKQHLANWLREQGFTVQDFGTHNADSVDYPDFAHPVASAVESGAHTFGLLLCGSANGVAITANKHQGVRAAICWTEELGRLARQHNNANVLCLPARFISKPDAEKILAAFLQTPFEGGRHTKRVDKISC
jgi:ribose 5-phosphate isomerase B